jgi:hypothetical protein
MFPFPSILRAKKTATLGPPARISIQGITETETCFRETCFRFHQSLVNSEKNDPTKLRRANLPAAGRFACGQKNTNPTLRHCLSMQRKNFGLFGLFRHLKFFLHISTQVV